LVGAENYYQHAEHYFRLIAAAQEQFRQNNPHLPRPENEPRDDGFGGDDDGDDEDIGQQQPAATAGASAYGTREPQPYLPPDAQPFPTPQLQPSPPRPHQPVAPDVSGNVDRLPSFITGGGSQQPQQAQQAHQPHSGHSQNGHDNQPDRFPLHRRRRRHRGPRHDSPGGLQQGSGGDGGDESSPRGE
jgi:type II secretory pathway pseudopilin PulG